MAMMNTNLCNTRNSMEHVCAVVLGGGRGSRLYPLTALRAKPAVPLFGRYRLIDIPLSSCIHSDVRRIFVITQFNSASLNSHIHSSYTFDSFTNGFVEILAAEQTMDNAGWFQGTADAIRQNLRHLRQSKASHYLILSGDQLYRMDYRALMATHLHSNADITVATLPVTTEDASHFGIVKVRKNGRINRFVEKPTDPDMLDNLATPPRTLEQAGIEPGTKRHLASMGVYIFSAKVLEDILEQQQDWIDFGKHVIPNTLKTHRVFSHVFSGFWEDIGTVRSYYETHMRLVKPNPPFDFYDPSHPIYTHPRYLPGSRLKNAVIKDSIICEGSRINRAEISNSIIGIRSILRPGAKVIRSIVMGVDYLEDAKARGRNIPVGIGANSSITGAIIDKNARIGKGVVIRASKRLRDQDGPGWAIRDGIVIVLKDATIPDRTHIG